MIKPEREYKTLGFPFGRAIAIGDEGLREMVLTHGVTPMPDNAMYTVNGVAPTVYISYGWMAQHMPEVARVLP